MELSKRDMGKEEEDMTSAAGLDRAAAKPDAEDDLPVADMAPGEHEPEETGATTEVEEEMPDAQSGLVDAGETGDRGAARGQSTEA